MGKDPAMKGSAAAAGHAYGSVSEVVPVRRRVVVALQGHRAPHRALGMARLIARALGVPLHAMFVVPNAVPPSEVPRRLRLPPDELEGVVLDVEVGEDPAEAL